jgi:uncharacterized protein with PIN domain
MFSVDTSVVVRLLAGDDQAQFKRAKVLFAKEIIIITTSVILECEWVLRYAYHFKPLKIKNVEDRVMEIFGVEKDVIYSKGLRRSQVAARNLLYEWAVRELGLTTTELPKRFRMTQPEVRYAVIQGDLIAKEKSYTLVK